jgi:hypothetical protein
VMRLVIRQIFFDETSICLSSCMVHEDGEKLKDY